MPPKRPRISVPMTAVIKEVIDEYCHAHGHNVADWARRLMLKAAGRKDLIATMPKPGKPNSKGVGDGN
jgi:hypothetical protein